MSEIISTLRRHSRTQPSMPALIGNDGIFTYGMLAAEVETRARVLRETGCAVAGLKMDNGPEWVIWDLACIEAGVVCVPLPLFFSPAQTTHAISASGIDMLITEAGLAKTEYKGRVELPENTAKITFTSGTTGAPRGVCLPQSGLEAVAQGILETVGQECAKRHFSILPLSILLENVAGVYSALLAGCACYIYRLGKIGFANPFKPDFVTMAVRLHENEATSAILVPELLRGLISAITAQQISIPSLRFVAVGGAKVSPALVEQARKAGIPVYEGYGLSECGSVVALNTPRADLPGKAGRVLPHIRLEVDENGEIIVFNPVFLGYVGEPHEGPLHTGDTGRLDARGFLSIEGRLKNIIITSYSRNISPEWPESILLSQPEIAQAIVYGEAMPALGALLVPSSAGADLAAAIQRVNAQLPDYAAIGHFHAVEPFTMARGMLTANGRPKRHEILLHYAALTEQEKSSEILRSAG